MSVPRCISKSLGFVSSSPSLDDTLKKLISMDVIKKEYPINNETEKKSIYTICDRLSHFYYRYIFPRISYFSVMNSYDFYDEFIGMKPTGNIVDSKGNIIAVEDRSDSIKKQESATNLLEDNPPVDLEDTSKVNECTDILEQKPSRILVVEHYYGYSLVDFDIDISEIDFEEYKKDIENKFWEGFVISINFFKE